MALHKATLAWILYASMVDLHGRAQEYSVKMLKIRAYAEENKQAADERLKAIIAAESILEVPLDQRITHSLEEKAELINQIHVTHYQKTQDAKNKYTIAISHIQGQLNATSQQLQMSFDTKLRDLDDELREAENYAQIYHAKLIKESEDQYSNARTRAHQSYNATISNINSSYKITTLEAKHLRQMADLEAEQLFEVASLHFFLNQGDIEQYNLMLRIAHDDREETKKKAKDALDATERSAAKNFDRATGEAQVTLNRQLNEAEDEHMASRDDARDTLDLELKGYNDKAKLLRQQIVDQHQANRNAADQKAKAEKDLTFCAWQTDLNKINISRNLDFDRAEKEHMSRIASITKPQGSSQSVLKSKFKMRSRLAWVSMQNPIVFDQHKKEWGKLLENIKIYEIDTSQIESLEDLLNNETPMKEVENKLKLFASSGQGLQICPRAPTPEPLTPPRAVENIHHGNEDDEPEELTSNPKSSEESTSKDNSVVQPTPLAVQPVQAIIDLITQSINQPTACSTSQPVARSTNQRAARPATRFIIAPAVEVSYGWIDNDEYENRSIPRSFGRTVDGGPIGRPMKERAGRPDISLADEIMAIFNQNIPRKDGLGKKSVSKRPEIENPNVSSDDDDIPLAIWRSRVQRQAATTKPAVAKDLVVSTDSEDNIPLAQSKSKRQAAAKTLLIISDSEDDHSLAIGKRKGQAAAKTLIILSDSEDDFPLAPTKSAAAAAVVPATGSANGLASTSIAGPATRVAVSPVGRKRSISSENLAEQGSLSEKLLDDHSSNHYPIIEKYKFVNNRKYELFQDLDTKFTLKNRIYCLCEDVEIVEEEHKRWERQFFLCPGTAEENSNENIFDNSGTIGGNVYYKRQEGPFKDMYTAREPVIDGWYHEIVVKKIVEKALKAKTSISVCAAGSASTSIAGGVAKSKNKRPHSPVEDTGKSSKRPKIAEQQAKILNVDGFELFTCGHFTEKDSVYRSTKPAVEKKGSKSWYKMQTFLRPGDADEVAAWDISNRKVFPKLDKQFFHRRMGLFKDEYTAREDRGDGWIYEFVLWKHPIDSSAPDSSAPPADNIFFAP